MGKMHTPEAFTELLLLLLITLGTAALFLRVKLPAVLGYLAVGITAGPSALALVHDLETIRALAELGVVLLLFTIGLEFSLPALARMRGALLGLGGAEVGIATAVAFGIAVWVGVGTGGAIVLGGVVAMSSTALVTKQLTDQLELYAPHGRSALAILLFQDIAVVPFLVVISGLAQPENGSIWITLGWALTKGAFAIAVILVAGHYIIRRALGAVAALRSGELFTLAALTVALGAAWWTSFLGLSPALGAFVAGMMLGEGAYRHTVGAEIRPFRDVLLALFFVSIGMLLDLSILPSAWRWILLLLSGLVIFKLALVFVLGRFARMSSVNSMRTAIVLAHGGEFGFALLTLGLTEGLLSEAYGQVVLAALLLSMALAPLALRFNGWLADTLLPGQPVADHAASTELPEELEGHVLIVGFGRVGQHVARLLGESDFRWIALDSDPVRVENARAASAPVTYGDGTRMEVLIAAGLDRARALTMAMDDPDAAVALVRTVRQRHPHLPILVRSRDDGPLTALQEAGATEVVPEDLEAGLMVGSHLLYLLGVPTEEIVKQTSAIRHSRYSLLRALFPGGEVEHPDTLELRGVEVPADARCIDVRIDALGLEEFGASVSALQRGSERIDAPGGATALAAGDIVILAGTGAALDRAEARLVRG